MSPDTINETIRAAIREGAVRYYDEDAPAPRTLSMATTTSATWMGEPVTVKAEVKEKKYERKCEVCGEKFKSENESLHNYQRTDHTMYKVCKTIECDECMKLDFKTFLKNYTKIKREKNKAYREEYI